MSYQEKKTIVSVVTGILVLAGYCIYVIGRYQSGMAAPDDMKFWASAMLIFIGIGVVASIVIQILFSHFTFRFNCCTGKCTESEM